MTDYPGARNVRPWTTPPASGGPDDGADDGHLDDLAAMRLADGEAAGAQHAAHVAACPVCRAIVDTFRTESAQLAQAFQLEESDMAALLSAALPQRVAARAIELGAVPAMAAKRDVAGLALGAAVAGAMAALGWQAAAGALIPGMAGAPWSNLPATVASMLVGWMIAVVRFGWVALQAIDQIPFVDTPAIPVLAVTVVVFAIAALLPVRAQRRLATA